MTLQLQFPLGNSPTFLNMVEPCVYGCPVAQFFLFFSGNLHGKAMPFLPATVSSALKCHSSAVRCIRSLLRCWRMLAKLRKPHQKTLQFRGWGCIVGVGDPYSYGLPVRLALPNGVSCSSFAISILYLGVISTSPTVWYLDGAKPPVNFLCVADVGF